MKNLPIGIQDFEKLRESDYLYIDKTESYIKSILSGKYFLLNRPRRFGKSLMISTLSYLYQGRKDLFTGLWIENNWDWTNIHPVIYLDINNTITRGGGTLKEGLMIIFRQQAHSYGVELESDVPGYAFHELIEKLADKGKKVVILVDEYDKPITDYITNPEIANEHSKILKSVYGALKSKDKYIEKAIITGVSKYGKVAIFSDLNNLFDLTLYEDANEICGYTEVEILNNFEDYLLKACDKFKISMETLMEWVRSWYNGYCWEGKNKIYNPFSILNFFQTLKFQNFWFDTGTPTLLSEILFKEKYQPEILEYLQSDDMIFNSADINHIDVLSLLFQTGYLTIKEVTGPFYDPVYTLGYPNNEVRISFNSYLLAAYTDSNPTHVGAAFMVHLKNALREKDWTSFFATTNSVFATVPYTVFQNTEAYYHSLVHVMLTMTGNLVLSEVLTNKGRIDSVLETEKMVVIFEFKMNSNAEKALSQIHEKGYPQRYGKKDKELILIGVNFNSENKCIDERLVG